jgi:uncharacterized protein (TIGR02265 family)
LSPPNPVERAAFLKAGVTGAAPWRSAYPRADFVAILEASATSRFGALPPEQRMAAIGRLSFDRFDSSRIGRAMLGVFRVLGPRRAIGRLARSFRNVNNFTEVAVEEVSPTHARVVMRQVIFEGFYLGIIQAGLERAGAVNGVVKVASISPERTVVYDVTWG